MKRFRIILSILLSFLVLISSTNFLFKIHLCCGKLKQLSFSVGSGNCENCTCIVHAKYRCCENQTVTHKSENLRDVTSEIVDIVPFNISSPVLISVIGPPFLNQFSVPNNYLANYQIFNRQAFLQVFLI